MTAVLHFLLTATEAVVCGVIAWLMFAGRVLPRRRADRLFSELDELKRNVADMGLRARLKLHLVRKPKWEPRPKPKYEPFPEDW